jgi:predicted MFS family arabinose efflux permease
LLRDRYIRRLIVAQWLPAMFVTGAEALVIPYASERGFPAGSAGFLLACLPVGMLAGDVLVGRFAKPATRERLVAPLIALCGGPLLGLAFGLPLLAICGLLAATGCGFAFTLGLQRRFRDAVDVSVRGQAFGLVTTGLMTLQGIGPGLFGTLAQLLPTGTAMSVAGLASLATAWWAWMKLRTK